MNERNPCLHLSHLPLDFIHYKKIHVDRLGALILTLAIPRLQTVRHALVFAAGYDLSLLRSLRLPGAIFNTFKPTPLSSAINYTQKA